MEYQIGCENSLAKVNSLGGELVFYSKNGLDYIWLGSSESWGGHSPVLFPTVGSLKNWEAEINGKVYPVKKHGFARKSEFELLELKSDRVAFSLKATEETKVGYPFDFELIITHTVFESGFKTEFKVINKDTQDILFGIGGHPGFICPLYDNTEFSDYYIEFNETENGPFYYTNPSDFEGVIHREDRINSLKDVKKFALDYSLFDKDVIILEKLNSKSIKLLNTKNNKGIKLKMQGFHSLGIWTSPLNKARFICLEPWTVTPDFSDHNSKFEDKPNITKLSPNKEFSVSYEMKII